MNRLIDTMVVSRSVCQGRRAPEPGTRARPGLYRAGVPTDIRVRGLRKAYGPVRAVRLSRD